MKDDMILVPRDVLMRVISQDIPGEDEDADRKHLFPNDTPVMLSFNNSWEYEEGECKFTIGDLLVLREVLAVSPR